MEEPGVKQCCAAFYGSDFARMLLGDSFHPGGTELTARLGELLGLAAQSSVLDIASGRGTSALHLAKTLGCRVTGIDLSEENVRAATDEAKRRGLGEWVRFEQADAEGLPFESASFDAIVCECAFCTFPSKQVAAREFHRVLKPGGKFGLSDLARSEEIPAGLEGLLSWVACIGDAQPVERYAAILEEAGLRVQCDEDHSGALLEMVRQIQGRLMGAEIMAGLKKIDVPGVDFNAAKEFANAAVKAIREGTLGYGIMVAGKPQAE